MKKILFIFALLYSGSVFASALEYEVNALKEDVAVLQRKMYEKNNSDSPSSSLGSESGNFGQSQEDFRKLVGRVDELEYKIKSLSSKIDMVNRDIDVRIKMIEGKPIEGGAGLQAPAPTPKFGASIAKEAPKSITGDSVESGDLKPLKTQDVNALYQEGQDAIKTQNYGVAEKSFALILERFPKEKLAGNAQYWLGEVYYAKKDYTKAAVSFAKGYQNYKDSTKGADSLLKLGMSMNMLNKKEEACAAFTGMKSEFPKAEKNIADRAIDEAKKLGCK